MNELIFSCENDKHRKVSIQTIIIINNRKSLPSSSKHTNRRRRRILETYLSFDMHKNK